MTAFSTDLRQISRTCACEQQQPAEEEGGGGGVGVLEEEEAGTFKCCLLKLCKSAQIQRAGQEYSQNMFGMRRRQNDGCDLIDKRSRTVSGYS